jgi:membrane-associated phospholipid phosphatase
MWDARLSQRPVRRESRCQHTVRGSRQRKVTCCGSGANAHEPSLRASTRRRGGGRGRIGAAIFRHFRLAAAILVATLAKLVLERVVKDIVTRQRPGTSIGPDVHLRGDVSSHGPSFVSGHAVLVTALAGLVTPYLRGRWKIAPWVLVGLVMFTRVYVGAHNPLDVVCGAALGLVIAGCLNLAFGVPATRDA